MITKWFYDNIYQPIKSLFSSKVEDNVEGHTGDVTIYGMGHIGVPVNDKSTDFLLKESDYDIL